MTTRKVRVSILKSKDQILDVFKQIHASIEKEKGRNLECIQLDNSGEYRGLVEYCKEHGIKIEKAVPKTPQHNGIVERMNHTINDKMRCMLSHAKLPKVF